MGTLALAASVTDCAGPGGGHRDDQPAGRWLFGPFSTGSTSPGFDERDLTPVTLPHCVADLSWWKWDPSAWSSLWIYRRHLLLRPNTGQRTWIRFGEVLSAASVYLNGHRLGETIGGYLPFSYEITDQLRPEDNLLAVVVDSRWGLNAPPGRPHPWRARSIDFYQPGGLSRPASVLRGPQIQATQVFASPVDVLTPQRRVDVSGLLDARQSSPEPVRITARLRDGEQVLAESSTQVPVTEPGKMSFHLTLRDLPQIRLWDLDTPNLYDVEVSVSLADAVIGRQVVHAQRVRIGFREARFERDGFFLNGRRVQLFGLNRHELYPYVGAAMPDRVQRRDAEFLKLELNCNMVRCSHYPQSEAFLDACDELGLLVWDEAPGWEYIGDKRWQDRAVGDVTAMVLRDRNHPSIIVWGTRLNETGNDVALYSRTRAVAQHFDGTRATTGAVNPSTTTMGHPAIPKEYRDPFTTHPKVQDVFAFNDYKRPRRNRLPTLHPPRTDLPYLVSEAVGVLTGPKHFRRTDPVALQARQALFHASVQNDAMSDPRYSGLLAWCAFDYPSGDDHSQDGIKWAGVCDIFREPKLGAAFYRAQTSPRRKIVIEPAFYWDRRTQPGRDSVIWSNCEELDVFVDRDRIARLSPHRDMFPHLPYPPFIVDFPNDAVRQGDLRVEGRIGDKVVATRTFSADRRQDELHFRPDDTRISADAVDATRLAVRIVDRFGAPRPFEDGSVSFTVDGPGELVGTNPFDLSDNGGTAAVWLRSTTRAGRVEILAQHPRFAPARSTVHTNRPAGGSKADDPP